ncbi:unnamed protein product [Allacma fusca]|uniref:Uncharacterized protein n=1 Tax=Allacma fusca TaxID=39272 RepID=A0A8J2LQP5_9HEXA|nr:unnamed protein product [Allacma fusca]
MKETDCKLTVFSSPACDNYYDDQRPTFDDEQESHIGQDKTQVSTSEALLQSLYHSRSFPPQSIIMSCSTWKFLCLIVAWVDIAFASLLVFATSIFVIMLLASPEELQEILLKEPLESEDELQKFLNLPPTVQYTSGISFLIFWVFMLILSVLLLKWVRQRYVPGLMFWFGANLLLAIICTPMDLIILMTSFSLEALVIFVLASTYCVFALIVVGCLIRGTVKRGKRIRESEEFQTF